MIQTLPVRWSGGVNLFADPTQVRDDQLRYAKNLVPTQGGLVLATRGAMKNSRDIFGPGIIEAIPVRAVFSPIGRELAIVYFAADQLRFGSGGDGTIVNAVDIAPAGVRNIPISIAQRFGETYVFTGYNPGYVLRDAANPDGYEIGTLSFTDINGNPVTFIPKGGASVRDRMFYWRGRSVVFSDRGAPGLIQNVDGDLMSIDVANDTFDDITHVQELNTTASGSPVQSVAAIWTTDAMYMLLGEPPETGDLDLDQALRAIQVSKLTVAAGCVSGATVVETPYGNLWAGPDDVWFLPFGSLPIRVGTNIRPALLNTPPALRYRWHAAYENGIYRLAIDAPGAGPTEISGCQHHWLLDMRNGPPQNADSAVWWGPQEYTPSGSDSAGPGTWCFVTSEGANGDGRVYAVQPWSATDDQGTGYGIGLCVLDADETRDEAAQNYPPNPPRGVTQYEVGDIVVPYDEGEALRRWNVWKCVTAGITAAEPLTQFNNGVDTSINSGGATFEVVAGVLLPAFIPVSAQSGNEIIPELVTKEFTGDPTKDKLYDGAPLGYWVSQKGRVSYRAISDIDESSRILSPAGDDLAASAIPIRGQRIWQSRLLTPQTGRRYHAKSLQFRYTHDTVFVVDATNDAITMRYNGELLRIPMTRGTYATLADLCTEIFSLAGGGNLVFNEVGSRLYVQNTSPQEWIFYFNQGAAPTDPLWQTGDFEKCARLFALLGVDTNNPNWYTSSPTWIWTNGGDNTNWVPAKYPVEQTRTFQVEMSGLGLRIDTFQREPT